MSEVSPGFRERVYAVVAQIPKGKVMTYGQIASACGSPMAARIVGGVAHLGPTELPWQRVVKKDGSLAEGYYGGVEGHRQALEQDGVSVGADLRVDMRECQWHP